ncbi:MAG: dienelactone hydrolase family protein [Acidiferrobacterales bacterium]
MRSFTDTLRVNGEEMALYGTMPDGSGPFAAVVVIQHAGGVDPFTRAMVDRLAEAGYAAVAPDLYHRLDPNLGATEKRQQLKDIEIIADVDTTVDFLRDHDVIDGERLGITGFCMGGRVVYLMAAANSHFKVAVAYYGGNIMVPWGDGVQAPFARTQEIAYPLMFHFGEEDTNPSPEDMRTLDEELARHGKAREFYSYPGAGHAFMDFSNPQRYREAADKTSWPRTLAFFGQHLSEK